jgi:hypothetical protein
MFRSTQHDETRVSADFVSLGYRESFMRLSTAMQRVFPFEQCGV